MEVEESNYWYFTEAIYELVSSKKKILHVNIATDFSFSLYKENVLYDCTPEHIYHVQWSFCTKEQVIIIQFCSEMV